MESVELLIICVLNCCLNISNDVLTLSNRSLYLTLSENLILYNWLGDAVYTLSCNRVNLSKSSLSLVSNWSVDWGRLVRRRSYDTLVVTVSLVSRDIKLRIERSIIKLDFLEDSKESNDWKKSQKWSNDNNWKSVVIIKMESICRGIDVEFFS